MLAKQAQKLVILPCFWSLERNAISDIALFEIREALEGLIDRNNMEDPTRRAIFLVDFLKSGG